MDLEHDDKANNGRGRTAWLRLVQQFDGEGIVTHPMAEAYEKIRTAVYTGKGKLTFDRYVFQHTEAHHILMEAGIVPDPQLLVADFIKGIKDERLTHVTAAVYSDSKKYLNDFVKTQLFYQEFVKQMNIQSGAGSGRQVSSVRFRAKMERSDIASARSRPWSLEPLESRTGSTPLVITRD